MPLDVSLWDRPPVTGRAPANEAAWHWLQRVVGSSKWSDTVLSGADAEGNKRNKTIKDDLLW